MIWFIVLVVITIIAFWIKGITKQAIVTEQNGVTATRISEYQELISQWKQQFSVLAAEMDTEGAPIALEQVEDFRGTYEAIMAFTLNPSDGYSKEVVDAVAEARESATSVFSQVYEPASMRALTTCAEFEVLNNVSNAYKSQFQIVAQTAECGQVTQEQVSILQGLMDDLKRAKAALLQYPAAVELIDMANVLEQSHDASIAHLADRGPHK